MTSNPPIRIGATRGGIVESAHSVHAVVAGPDGDALHVFGDAERMVFPRSSLKAIQALPLVETGAADAFGCSQRELALACASHEGEHYHIGGVESWLGRIGLNQDSLVCGPEWPRRREDSQSMLREGAVPGRVHNNCSGKHSGMLTTARHMREEAANYVGLDHGVQRRVFEAIEALTGQTLENVPIGIDGCSAPNPALPLGCFAVAAARYAEASDVRLGPVRAAACQRLMAAMRAAPEMVGGTSRVDTDLIRGLGGRVLSKTGAEGVYFLYLPERKLGVALKAEDGNPRASTGAIWSVLDRLGELDDGARDALRPHCRPVLRNWDGLEIGEIREV